MQGGFRIAQGWLGFWVGQDSFVVSLGHKGGSQVGSDWLKLLLDWVYCGFRSGFFSNLFVKSSQASRLQHAPSMQ